jgi:hypothetical protein
VAQAQAQDEVPRARKPSGDEHDGQDRADDGDGLKGGVA